MRFIIALASSTTLGLLAGCATLDPRGIDTLAAPGPGQGVLFATTEYVTPNADGVRCDKKTCKADKISTCSDFAANCKKYDHVYTGDDQSGTCTRSTAIPIS